MGLVDEFGRFVALEPPGHAENPVVEMRQDGRKRHLAGLQLTEIIFSGTEVAFGRKIDGQRSYCRRIALALAQIERAQLCLGGMLLPFVYGIVFLGEALTAGKVICVVLIAAAMALSVERGASQKAIHNGIWRMLSLPSQTFGEGRSFFPPHR